MISASESDISDEVTVAAQAAVAPKPWRRILSPKVSWRVAYRSLAVFAVLCWAAVSFIARRRSVEQAQRLGQRVATRILRIAGVSVVRQGETRAGPGLVVCNHRSYIDILAVISAAPTTFLCKREVGRWPLIGAIAAGLGVVFVDRGSKQSRRESLARVAEAVLAGHTITAFPEGTTTRGPGMRETRPGLFGAAERYGFAVIPAVIEYTDPDDAWVGDDTLLRHCSFWLAKPRGQVTFRMGPPLRHTEAAGSGLQARAETWMRSALEDLNRSLDRERDRERSCPLPER